MIRNDEIERIEKITQVTRGVVGIPVGTPEGLEFILEFNIAGSFPNRSNIPKDTMHVTFSGYAPIERGDTLDVYIPINAATSKIKPALMIKRYGVRLDFPEGYLTGIYLAKK